MVTVEWNAVRVGDAVFVHSESGDLVAGKVAFVEGGDAPGDPNSIGVRIEERDETYYAWPSVEGMHRDPLDPNEACERCQPDKMGLSA